MPWWRRKKREIVVASDKEREAHIAVGLDRIYNAYVADNGSHWSTTIEKIVTLTGMKYTAAIDMVLHDWDPDLDPRDVPSSRTHIPSRRELDRELDDRKTVQERAGERLLDDEDDTIPWDENTDRDSCCDGLGCPVCDPGGSHA